MNIKSIKEDGIPVGSWRLTFWGNEQWSCFFTRNCNWYDFTIIEVTFERASYTGRYFEGSFALMGLQWGFEIFHREERQGILGEFNKMIEEVRSTKCETFPEED